MKTIGQKFSLRLETFDLTPEVGKFVANWYLIST